MRQTKWHQIKTKPLASLASFLGAIAFAAIVMRFPIIAYIAAFGIALIAISFVIKMTRK